MTDFKNVRTDFGPEKIDIKVPKSSIVAEFKDPDVHPNPIEEIERAISNPFGSPPLEKLIKPNMKVAIGHDDPTKPPMPWQIILKFLIKKLINLGIKKKDIFLISANGNHKQFSNRELKRFLGDEIFDDFYPSGQVLNHDCLDRNKLKFLGKTKGGAILDHNKLFLESDLMIYVGQVVAHSWGGYTGTGAAIGLASTESIASHHNFHVVDHPETTLGDQKRMYFRKLKAEINDGLEKAINKRIFYINWLGGTGGTISRIYAGYSPELEEPSWDEADKFSIIDVPQADVLVIGLPENFAYGSSNNSLITAIGMAYPPRIWLNDHVLKKGGVIIGLNPSNGLHDQNTFPSTTEFINLLDKVYNISEMTKFQNTIAKNKEYLEKYRNGNAYHPIHPFWMLYACNYMLERSSKVILAGTKNPGIFRKLNIEPTKTFDDAFDIAKRIRGDNLTTIVAPTFWSKRPFKFRVT